jgi:hypothetical protein
MALGRSLQVTSTIQRAITTKSVDKVFVSGAVYPNPRLSTEPFSLTDLDTFAPEADDACRAVVHSTEGVALRGMPASSGRVLRNLPTGLHARGTRD